jgi:PEP-CTERM motif
MAMVSRISVVFLAALVSLGPSVANAAPFFVTVPNNLADAVGNTTDGSDGDPVDIRVQVLYGSGQFSSVGGPIWIDQMAWRSSPGEGPTSGSAGNLDIYLSTSPRFPNLNGGAALFMSDVFADNVGPDNTLVYSGLIAFSSPGCDIVGNTPCPWDVIFNFDNPFYYDPAAGRLLVDLHFSSLTGGSGALDAVDFETYGPIATLVAELDDESGGISTDGDITRFRYQSAVPEPASGSLLLFGSAALGLIRRRNW